MSTLEQLGLQSGSKESTKKPFELWKGTSVKDWEVTMRLLTIGEIADVERLIGDIPATEAAKLRVLFILAKALVAIDGRPVATDEDVFNYNKEHDLTGTRKVDILGYKLLFIRKWSEPVILRLVNMYDEVQEEYLSSLYGGTLPDELRASVLGTDLAAVTPTVTSDEGNPDDDSSTT